MVAILVVLVVRGYITYPTRERNIHPVLFVIT